MVEEEDEDAHIFIVQPTMTFPPHTCASAIVLVHLRVNLPPVN